MPAVTTESPNEESDLMKITPLGSGNYYDDHNNANDSNNDDHNDDHNDLKDINNDDHNKKR